MLPVRDEASSSSKGRKYNFRQKERVSIKQRSPSSAAPYCLSLIHILSEAEGISRTAHASVHGGSLTRLNCARFRMTPHKDDGFKLSQGHLTADVESRYAG